MTRQGTRQRATDHASQAHAAAAAAAGAAAVAAQRRQQQQRRASVTQAAATLLLGGGVGGGGGGAGALGGARAGHGLAVGARDGRSQVRRSPSEKVFGQETTFGDDSLGFILTLTFWGLFGWQYAMACCWRSCVTQEAVCSR